MNPSRGSPGGSSVENTSHASSVRTSYRFHPQADNASLGSSHGVPLRHQPSPQQSSRHQSLRHQSSRHQSSPQQSSRHQSSQHQSSQHQELPDRALSVPRQDKSDRHESLGSGPDTELHLCVEARAKDLVTVPENHGFTSLESLDHDKTCYRHILSQEHCSYNGHNDDHICLEWGPTSVGWETIGLKRLLSGDQFCIKRTITCPALFMCYGRESNIRYHIHNSMGTHVLTVTEESMLLARWFFCREQTFVLHATNERGEEVMRMSRDRNCCAQCSTWEYPYGHELVVESPPGRVIGYVRQLHGCYGREYTLMLQICDSNGNAIFNVTTLGNCGASDGRIEVWSRDILYSLVAYISQVNADHTEPDIILCDCTLDTHYEVRFNLPTSGERKALVIGAAFLAHYMKYFQFPPS